MEIFSQLQWWHWLVGGIILIVAELAIPTFYLIWFGLGGLLVGLSLALFDLSPTAQILLWIVASLAFTFIWFR